MNPARSGCDQRNVRRDDDPRRPAPAQRHEYPGAENLQHGVNCEQWQGYLAVTYRCPKGGEPSRVHRHDPRVMGGSYLKSASCEEPRRIATIDRHFGQPLDRHKRHYDIWPDHTVRRSVSWLAVNPGPSALSADNNCNPAAR